MISNLIMGLGSGAEIGFCQNEVGQVIDLIVVFARNSRAGETTPPKAYRPHTSNSALQENWRALYALATRTSSSSVSG
jgi:hypothetical protein